ncbi:MAG: penicillin-binding transpeptidase domain-containing protein [Candidatus Omnitrophota bacterium]
MFYLQAVSHNFYFKIADEQHSYSIELPPTRGTIYDRNMRVLAVNLNSDSVYANARIIKDKPLIADKLSSILNMDKGLILERLSRDKAFIWIKRKVTPEEAAKIKSAKLSGIELVKESKRFYPNRSMACHLLGAVNIDNAGLEGIELLYDKYLKGQSGWLASSRDARSKILESYQDEYVPAKDGFNMVLTIDEVIQHIAERELEKIYLKYNAKAASIVIIDPKNGDVLALANFPNFDLNETKNRPVESIRNRAINDFFEPGSVFKIVTASAVLEENIVGLDDKFYCENGLYKVGRRLLHDVHPYGTLTFRQVIEKSSNIGTIKIAGILGPDRLYKYLKLFGFYDKTGVDLPGEVVGMNRPVSKWTPSSMLAIPMGQEVTVTAMQLASAIAVIADNGYKVRPRIVRRIVDSDGQVVKEFPAKIVRKVMSPKTAAKMRAVLMGAVENGTGKKAKIEDYHTGGKTGTAQKVEGGTYSHGSFIASFIGFAPVEKPVLAVAVCVDEPHPVYYGGDVAAPVFKNVVDETLKYMHAKSAK